MALWSNETAPPHNSIILMSLPCLAGAEKNSVWLCAIIPSSRLPRATGNTQSEEISPSGLCHAWESKSRSCRYICVRLKKQVKYSARHSISVPWPLNRHCSHHHYRKKGIHLVCTDLRVREGSGETAFAWKLMEPWIESDALRWSCHYFPFLHPHMIAYKYKSSPFFLKPEIVLLKSLIVCLFWKYKPEKRKKKKVNQCWNTST